MVERVVWAAGRVEALCLIRLSSQERDSFLPWGTLSGLGGDIKLQIRDHVYIQI